MDEAMVMVQMVMVQMVMVQMVMGRMVIMADMVEMLEMVWC